MRKVGDMMSYTPQFKHKNNQKRFNLRKPWRDIFYLLFITYYLLYITYHLLLTTYHLLITTFYASYHLSPI